MVAAVALAIGDRTLPRYGHRYRRHDFRLAQLFACLVLRKFFRTDYRGIVAILQDWPLVREKLRLNKTPHFTTLLQSRAASAYRSFDSQIAHPNGRGIL